MSNSGTPAAEGFLRDLDKIAQARQEIAGYLFNMADMIEAAEHAAQVKLNLQNEVARLRNNAQALKDGIFRLLVLGDMKRGKSTALNAILGEDILPSEVTPCTAILTTLRYGKQSSVTVHFDDGKQQKMSFKDFKRNYTIPYDVAKDAQAFPDVSHAIIEYPLPLLEKGVEIIDSPGLNDTEQRNDMSLGYIRNSHAILFVLNAVQQLTSGEERYFDTYMRGNGLTIFFLLNRWDAIRSQLHRPDNATVAQEEERVRRYFHTNLQPIVSDEKPTLNGADLYSQRVFEVSALNALHARLGGDDYGWQASGFAAFTKALTHFLTHERAIAELNPARVAARSASQTVRRTATERIGLLPVDTKELKEKIDAVQPEFDKLSHLGRQFNAKIHQLGMTAADDVARSFRAYCSTLDRTFEQDFTRYMPEIPALISLRKGKREEFEMELKQQFERYIQERIAAWFRQAANDKLRVAFADLKLQVGQYAFSYTEITNRISAILTATSGAPKLQAELPGESSLWQRLTAGNIGTMAGDVAGGAMGGLGVFNKGLAASSLGFVALGGVLAALHAFTGFTLAPLMFAFYGSYLSRLIAQQVRGAFLQKVKEEFVKVLPTIAQQESDKISQSVNQLFANYGTEVQKLIDADIDSRRKQLDNLLKEKETREIDIIRETDRLQKLIRDVENEYRKLEAACNSLSGGRPSLTA
jgi:GTPase SAR1 family protein